MAGRLGLEMLTFFGMNPVEVVRLAGELGCSVISTGAARVDFKHFGADFAWPMWSLQDDANLRRELISEMQASGVRIGLAEGFGAWFGAEWPDARPKLDLMASLGAERINASTTDPDLGRCHDQLALLAEQTVERGMRFTIEFAPTTTFPSLQAAIDLVEHIGRDKMGILVDAMHLFRSGSTIADFKAMDPELISYAQLCDAPLAPSAATYMEEAMFERLLPGEGELPLREWVAALPDDCPISMEVPRLADFRAGLTKREQGERVVAAAHAVGA
jgi:sugar phosphate isomerase/epimerase